MNELPYLQNRESVWRWMRDAYPGDGKRTYKRVLYSLLHPATRNKQRRKHGRQ